MDSDGTNLTAEDEVLLTRARGGKTKSSNDAATDPDATGLKPLPNTVDPNRSVFKRTSRT